MFDTGKAVYLAGHEHELEQVALDFGDQLGDALDHLAGQILVVLGQQDVLQVVGHGTIALLAARQKTVDALGQLAKLRHRHFFAHEALPIGAEGLGFGAQIIEHRCALLHQVHGPVGRPFGQPHHIFETLGGIGNLRDFLSLGHVRVDLEIDDRTVQLASQFAHFLIQAAIAGLVQLMDQLHRLAELALFQAGHQLVGMLLQGRLEVTQ
ncbi:hypothetical protein D9M71_490830 [compost metagenome]